MSDLFWLTDAQMARLEPFFPKSHGKPLVDDRRVLSGIIFINRNGLRWRDAPQEHGLNKTLYKRWKRWSDKGIFARMMAGLFAHLKRHLGLRRLRLRGPKGANEEFLLAAVPQNQKTYGQNGPMLRHRTAQNRTSQKHCFRAQSQRIGKAPLAQTQDVVGRVFHQNRTVGAGRVNANLRDPL